MLRRSIDAFRFFLKHPNVNGKKMSELGSKDKKKVIEQDFKRRFFFSLLKV